MTDQPWQDPRSRAPQPGQSEGSFRYPAPEAPAGAQPGSSAPAAQAYGSAPAPQQPNRPQQGWGSAPRAAQPPVQQPGYAAQQPGYGRQHEGYAAQQPGLPSQQQPGFPSQQQAYGTQQQAYGTQQPGPGSQHAPQPGYGSAPQGSAPHGGPVQGAPGYGVPGPAPQQSRPGYPQGSGFPGVGTGSHPGTGAQQPAPGGYPEQRAYSQSRLRPSVTQEMRSRSQIHQHSGAQLQASWTQQATSAMRREDPTKGADLARLIIGIVVCAVLGLGFLLILLLGALSFRGVGVIIVLLSLLPLSVIIGMVLWFDRWKPQPKLILGLCVLWGAVASVIIVFITQLTSIYALGAFGIDASGDVVGAVVMAPIFEEGAKGIFLVALVLGARKYFEGPLDGWMYGTLIGAGFAFTENLLYLGSAYDDYQSQGLILTFAMRCVVSPLLHSTFTGMAGIAIGLAARRGSWWLTALMWIPGYIVGAFLHGLWNGVATATDDIDPLASIAITLVFSACVSALWFGSGLYLRHEETKQTRLMLGDYANAGWLTHAEVDMLGTWKGRRAGRRWASQFPGGKTEMKAMIRAAASLSSIRERILGGVGGRTEIARERFELDELTQARSRLMASARMPARRP